MENSTISGKKVYEFTKDFSVLYVEDDKKIVGNMSEVLNKLFKKVYLENDGLSGLKTYRKNSPDIVITDIQMPILDGISMAKKIKQECPAQRFIIATAFNDAIYYDKAIKLGTDGFIVKPIKSNQLYETIYKTAQSLYFEKAAESYKEQLEKRVKEEVEKNTAQIQERNKALSNLIEAFPNPAVVFDKEGTKIFSNASFAVVFSDKELARIEEINEYIVKKENHATAIEKINEKTDTASIRTKNGIKVFKIIITPLNFKDKEMSRLVTFNDITVEEYRKLKVKNYNEIVKDFYLCKATHKKENVTKPDKSEQTAGAAEERPLDIAEHEMLRKSNEHKISAQAYIAEIDDYVLEQIRELEELENEFDDYLYSLEENPLDIHTVKHFFTKYATTMSLLFEFELLSQSLKGIATLFNDISIDTFDNKKQRKIKILIQEMFEDVKSWRNAIFTESFTKDIHYFDSSLFSSCLQMEAILFEREVVDTDENDLDLF